jgi:hypothetical protein
MILADERIHRHLISSENIYLKKPFLQSRLQLKIKTKILFTFNL